MRGMEPSVVRATLEAQTDLLYYYEGVEDGMEKRRGEG